MLFLFGVCFFLFGVCFFYSEMVLADYLQWLDNNYGKKNMLAKQNSQDKKRVETSSINICETKTTLK